MTFLGLAFIGAIGYVLGLYLLRPLWKGADYFLCRHCGYNLRGMTSLRREPGESVCPECGHALTEETVERASTRDARRSGRYVAVLVVVASASVLGLCSTILLFGWWLL